MNFVATSYTLSGQKLYPLRCILLYSPVQPLQRSLELSFRVFAVYPAPLALHGRGDPEFISAIDAPQLAELSGRIRSFEDVIRERQTYVFVRFQSLWKIIGRYGRVPKD